MYGVVENMGRDLFQGIVTEFAANTEKKPRVSRFGAAVFFGGAVIFSRSVVRLPGDHNRFVYS